MNSKKFLTEAYFRPQRFIANIFDKPAVVLIYHRVAELQQDPQLLAVKPDNFYKQIEFLKKNYNLLTIEEFNFIVTEKKKFSRNSVLITFDDGYADNANYALPVLESLGAQALFFITTSNINTNEEMWWDKMDQIFFSGRELPSKLTISIKNKNLDFDLSNERLKLKTYYALHSLIKFNKKEVRDDVINRLFKWANVEQHNRNNYRMVNGDELLKMDVSHSSVIGAHTHTHTPLSILSYDEQFQDVEQSKVILEKLLKHPVKYFSYPFGSFKDYNNESVEVCKKLGFNFVCANFYFQVHKWTSKYELPRALVRDWDFENFKKQTRKFFKY
jgi:peptidoglycan/xylan/chitin deacetylase (PgdA/CDA1 family)